MKSLKEDYYNPDFSHIYIEKDALGHPRTKRILSHFPKAKMIEIGHYKDIFCRRGQNYVLQHKTKNLILAVKEGSLIYEGAPVCQNFGNKHFYYASCIMNCIYDCEYCYLKGMYPSGNMVIFVNLEDFFAEVKTLLAVHPVYLCISYDTDLLAFEAVTEYSKEWVRFAEECGNLIIEIRTKSANQEYFRQSPASQIIYAFTMSPQAVIDAYEHQTPSFRNRIECAKTAASFGHLIRLCFDPMIYVPDWKIHYDAMLQQIDEELGMEKVLDVSVGTFRVSQDYLKKMRKNEPYSAVVQFPYQNIGGIYQYPKELSEQMEQYMVSKLKEKIPEEKIFLWK